MAFDGTTLAGVVHEISVLEGGRIDKIAQPEPDEIFIGVRAKGTNYKLLFTANANAPRVGFTKQSKTAPLTAPMFCMVLRKHISGGRIVSITQPEFERIVEFRIDALDEMGDRTEKILTIEIMGKHSNILLLSGDRVVDAIKHVPFSVSAVRQILPGAAYSRPPSQGKSNPLKTAKDAAQFSAAIFYDEPKQTLQKAIYQNHTGISPILAAEICARAELSPEKIPAVITEEEKSRLHKAFAEVISQIESNNFTNIIYRNEQKKAMDLTVLPFAVYEHFQAEKFESPSEMLEVFYFQRDEAYRISQKTADMRKLITTHQERCHKKSFVYDKTLKEIEDRDKLRLNGELLTAYLYMVPQGASSFTAQNFYEENAPHEIALNPALTASENAQKFFKLYNKQKRTFAALQEQIAKNQEDLAYLESVAAAIETAQDEADIAEIRAELAEMGFAKKRANAKNKKAPKPAKPLKFTSSDGFDIYVGKNNTQNDTLTLKTARAHDIWFHTKDIAGSHVILVTGGKEPTETAILEAANLAALNSRAKNSAQVPVDYVARKHVRKPSGAKPGYVIYDYHKTVYVTPQEV
ncbi:MAG: NFACT family protein [Defluviitaleaceae bacterium]|nr:NFACT family protein [Defluviitaleaceae bacterium]MCL2264268.1 NFACT family protein [Defluviitaleaceae bacterium]